MDKLMENSRAKKLNKKLEKILALDDQYKKMSDEELQQKSSSLMKKAKAGESESELMTEAFALVREATWRTLGMKQYPVQLKGGISIAEGNLAEMATGEGKTIVVPLVAYLHALSGKNVHVVTSNDYLAKRDSEQMSKLFGFLGMSVGLSAPQMSTQDKKQAYSCNITYTTAQELGFDYLRDNMATCIEDRVQRGLNSIVIDEADNALLDEASTPLILAKEDKLSEFEKNFLMVVAKFVDGLEECKDSVSNGFANDGDFYVDNERMTASFSEKGIEKIQNFFHVEDLFCDENYELLSFCNNALKAKTLFINGVNYVVKDGEVKIVGETTGRILTGRRYQGGIQQAIEAKEGVAISDYSKTQSNINFQNFFRLYENIGGMSGTCKTDEDELEEIYGIRVDKIETNRPLRRKDEHFHFYHAKEQKNQALKNRILDLHNSGRPILIGATSIESSVELTKLLDEMGLDYNLLNATNNEKESKIIAQAGKKGAITIATNMAGRGTDIKLGGNPTFMAIEEMEKLGFSSALISFADSYLQPSNDEEKNAREKFSQLKSEFKKQTDSEKVEVMGLGGLAVIGTALNTSRRVDNQLRGRAGRQGEPGSSEFFVSWADMCDTFNVPEEGEEDYFKLIEKRKVDTNKEITDTKVLATIEEMQKTSESQLRQARKNNFNINTPENLQRIAVYSEKDDVMKMIEEFDPQQVQLDKSPSTKLEQYLFDLYISDISNSIKAYKNCVTPSNALEAGDNFRSSLKKYGFHTDKITDNYLQNTSINEIVDQISIYVLEIFKKAINETQDIFKYYKNEFQTNVLQAYNTSWENHLERLENAKYQLSIGSLTSQSAIHDFVKDAYNSYDNFKNEVYGKVIQATSSELIKMVLNQKAKNADAEVQKQSSQTNLANKSNNKQ